MMNRIFCVLGAIRKREMLSINSLDVSLHIRYGVSAIIGGVFQQSP